MKKMKLFLLGAAILCAFRLGAREYENILLYKKCGTWKSSTPVIEKSEDAGRVLWKGKQVRFTPRSGTFDPKNIYCFGYSIKVPENMRGKQFSIKFIYEEGKPVSWNVRTPGHTGWCGGSVKLQRDHWPYIRPDKLKALEFVTDIPDFQAVLEDIRFVPAGMNYQLEEAWLPPLTNGCFFPEFTLEQQKKETLSDPAFKAKMEEIEKLRKSKLKIPLSRVYKDPKERKGNPMIARINADGSVKGISYEDAIQFHNKNHYPHDYNETYMMMHTNFYSLLLGYWIWGRIDRTDENRAKIFRGMIRALIAEINRRGEPRRYVVASFLWPQTAVRAYGVFFDEMEAVEKGISRDPDAVLLNRLLKEAVSWAYIHPTHSTAGPALTVDAFRHSSAWTGGNFSYRPTFRSALICRNPKMLDVISKVTEGSLGMTSFNTMKEAFWLDGMTADGSAWGHKNQNYPFGYPLDGRVGIGTLIGDLSGSRWELKADGAAMNSVCNYLDSLLWHGTGWAENKTRTIPEKYMLQRDIPTACGRIGQLYREGKGYSDFEKAYKTVNIYLNLMPEGSVQRQWLKHCSDIMGGRDAVLPVGARYFWNNDLLICRGEKSLAAISMLSSRVLAMEVAPSDSKYTDFWSEGAAWIMKHFDSYRIARGFMKPCAVPGVTSRQWDLKHTGNAWRRYTGMHNFAGGADNGNYAVCAYHMERRKEYEPQDPNFYRLEARKSYFWLNGKLICIGTGITDHLNTGVPVATTIDQTLWRTPAVFASGSIQKPGSTFHSEAQTLWHDGVGYWVLNGKGILSGETRQDRWAEFDWHNSKVKDLPQNAPMLMFQIEHGKNVKNGSYAYAVDFHSRSFAELQKEVKAPSFEILAMTGDMHAVREKSSGTLAAVFYKPGEIGGLKVNAPAVVLLRRTKNGDIEAAVNDPLQNAKLDSVTLTWENVPHEIKLPAGLYCGQPVTVNLSTNKPIIKEYNMKKTAIAIALAAAVSGQAQNLIQNPDFQKADPRGRAASWVYQDKQFTRVNADKPGRFVMKSAEIVRPAEKLAVNVSISQRIKISKPGKYVLTFTGKIVKQGALNASWAFYDKNMKLIRVKGDYWSKAHFGKESKKITHIIDIPEGVAAMDLRVTGIEDKRRKENSGSVIIEEVTLTPQK